MVELMSTLNCKTVNMNINFCSYLCMDGNHLIMATSVQNMFGFDDNCFISVVCFDDCEFK
jgi:hypothetical protein